MVMALASRSWVTVARIFFRHVHFQEATFRARWRVGTEEDATCDETRPLYRTTEISATAGYENPVFLYVVLNSYRGHCMKRSHWRRIIRKA